MINQQQMADTIAQRLEALAAERTALEAALAAAYQPATTNGELPTGEPKPARARRFAPGQPSGRRSSTRRTGKSAPADADTVLGWIGQQDPGTVLSTSAIAEHFKFSRSTAQTRLAELEERNLIAPVGEGAQRGWTLKATDLAPA